METGVAPWVQVKIVDFGSEISSRSPRGSISDPLNLTVWFARDQHGDPVQAEMSINVSDDRDPLAVAVSSDCTPSFNSLLIISSKAVKSSRQTLSVWRSRGGFTCLGRRRYLVPPSRTCGHTRLFPGFVET